MYSNFSGTFPQWLVLVLMLAAFGIAIRVVLSAKAPWELKAQQKAGTPATVVAFARCPRPKCHADNTSAANYCRRCGCRMNGGPEPRSAFSDRPILN